MNSSFWPPKFFRRSDEDTSLGSGRDSHTDMRPEVPKPS